MNAFQEPMQPFPGLERYAKQVTLPGHEVRLFLFDTGEAGRTPVLLVHGLGDEADTWRHIFPLLSSDYRLIAPDLPGFGRSDPSARRLTIPYFAGVLWGLLDHLSLPRAILVGHSTGAIIAHHMALEQPERVEKLVLVGGSLVAANTRASRDLLFFLTPILGEWIYTRLRKDPQAAYRSLEPYYHNFSALPQADRDFLYQRVNQRVWSDNQRRGFFSTLRNMARWLPAQQGALPGRLGQFRGPAEVIWGKNDQVNSVENAHALAKLAPSARLVIVPEAGHNVQQEKPEVIAAAVTGGDA